MAALQLHDNGTFNHQIIGIGALVSLTAALVGFDYFDGFQTAKSTVPTKAELAEKLALA